VVGCLPKVVDCFDHNPLARQRNVSPLRTCRHERVATAVGFVMDSAGTGAVAAVSGLAMDLAGLASVPRLLD
jgi:hypothetical protein